MTDQDRKIALEIVTKRPLQPDWESLLEDIAAALSAARGRWVPVGERLPERNGYPSTHRVLVVTAEGNRLIGSNTGPRKWFNPEASDWIADVVAWRELPAPPREGE